MKINFNESALDIWKFYFMFRKGPNHVNHNEWGYPIINHNLDNSDNVAILWS